MRAVHIVLYQGPQALKTHKTPILPHHCVIHAISHVVRRKQYVFQILYWILKSHNFTHAPHHVGPTFTSWPILQMQSTWKVGTHPQPQRERECHAREQTPCPLVLIVIYFSSYIFCIVMQINFFNHQPIHMLLNTMPVHTKVYDIRTIQILQLS